jgi:seryl-tRNA synthetase
MKTLIKNHWKTGLIIILSFLIGVILVRSCGSRQPVTDRHASIDSLKNENQVTQAKYTKLSDSIQGVILKKDEQTLELTKTLNSITTKYRILINREPSHDTVIQTNQVFIGNECLEKLPVIQGQLDICNSIVEDYKEGMNIKLRQINSLQGQFDRSMAISQSQEKDIKKLKRKLKWTKIGMVSGAVVIVGASIFVLAK